MTNKDYSYLDDFLASIITVMHYNIYHHDHLRQETIDATNEKLRSLSADERKYLEMKTREYFKNQRKDHERNQQKHKI